MKLAAGRYWLVLTPLAKLQTFDTWVRSNPGRVSIERTEAGDLAEKGLDGAWVLFNVAEPMAFDAQQFGTPNAAGPDVQHASDTGHGKTTPPSLQEQATDLIKKGDLLASLNRALGNAPGVLLLLAAAVYLSQGNRK